MNNIEKRIKEVLFHQSQKDIDEVMEIVKEYLGEAFYAGRDEYHRGCGWEQTYPNFDDWYKEMEALSNE